MKYKHRDIVIAYMDGKKIQVKDGDTCWRNLNPFDGSGIWPPFTASNAYRIKPETGKYRVALFSFTEAGVNHEVYLARNNSDVACYAKAPGFVRWLSDWVEYEID